MSDFPRAGPSEPRSYSVSFLTQNGQNNIPLSRITSPTQRTVHYTSGKKIPMTPTPSRSSTPDADNRTIAATLASSPLSGLCTECVESPAESEVIQNEEPDSSRTYRLADVCHKYNPQKVFENRGSTARDHLASERTFLAYVRTSLALASTGVALVQLFTISDLTSRGADMPVSEASRRVQRFARPLGASTVVMALILLGIAVYRYFLIQGSLPANIFPVARFSVVFTTFVLSALVVIVFAVLIEGR